MKTFVSSTKDLIPIQKDLMTWWKTCLKRTSKPSKDFFFFFNERLDSNSERLDDLMKDWFEGDFINLEIILLLQRKTWFQFRKTWWLDERLALRGLQKHRKASFSSMKDFIPIQKDLMTWWKTCLKGTSKT